MRKTLLTLCLLFLMFMTVTAQIYTEPTYVDHYKSSEKSSPSFEITPLIGFQLGGKIKFIQGRLDINDDMMYGGAISMPLDEYGDVEFAYTRMDSRANFRSTSDLRSGSFNLSVDYFQLGYLRYTQKGNLRPYGLISAGATLFNSKSDNVDDTMTFSMTLGGGIKYYISDNLGIRLQGRLLLPMYFDGAGLMIGFNGSGSYSSVGVSSSQFLVQGDFSFGLVYRFGN
ncbi:MAG: porin family protein [Prolixibacteraceae bacterium]|nr:porin family protein [Prolixibacteraceae bacterium]